jgi:hypothetical protein
MNCVTGARFPDGIKTIRGFNIFGRGFVITGMKPTRSILLLLCAWFVQMSLVMSLAQTCLAQTRSLTNSDIIEMTKAGVSPAVIVTSIQSTPVRFDVSPEGLISLTAGGVKDAVINQMIRAAARAKFDASFGVATGKFPAGDAAGHKVRFSARIRTENVATGYAGLWWRVDGEDGKQLAFDNSQARYIDGEAAPGNGSIRGATGNTEWKLYELELPVAAAVKNINFGGILTGTGTAWFDSMRVELDGVPYLNPQFDFDFESPAAKGFFTGGPGYSVAIDNTTSYTGKQSLKMKFIGDGGQATK